MADEMGRGKESSERNGHTGYEPFIPMCSSTLVPDKYGTNIRQLLIKASSQQDGSAGMGEKCPPTIQELL